MHYREINVNDKIYEYVVANTVIKIKGIGVFNKREIGDKIEKRCDCCGEKYSDIGRKPEYSYSVTPKHIRELVLKHA